MTVSEAKRLKALVRAIVRHWSEGNGKGEREAEAAVSRADARHGGDEGTAVKKVVAPSVKREAVTHLKTLFGLSERRACEIAGADRKIVRYQSQRAPDTALRGRLRYLADELSRFGYRRLFVLLRHPRRSAQMTSGLRSRLDERPRAGHRRYPPKLLCAV